MMTDLGLFFIPAALSALSKAGSVQPPAVPSAAKLPIFSKLRREKLSEMRKFCSPGYLSIWQALVGDLVGYRYDHNTIQNTKCDKNPSGESNSMQIEKMHPIKRRSTTGRRPF
jgi:hypothetical protein